jgi:hypothetical protein
MTKKKKTKKKAAKVEPKHKLKKKAAKRARGGHQPKADKEFDPKKAVPPPSGTGVVPPNSKKPRRRIVGEQRRLNLKLDEDLAMWVFEYAEAHSTTVTQLIVDYLVQLRKQEYLAQDAKQI